MTIDSAKPSQHVLPGIAGSSVAFLDQRESMVRERILSVTLLGELDTSIEDCEQLGAAIAALIRTLGNSSATTRLQSRYPVCLAEFLVSIGMHYYRQGDYWSSVVARTGLAAQNYPSRWGELFERIIAACQIELFESFRDEQATRYVSKILAHGGIPTYCLDDFFGRLIVPLVSNGRHRDAITADLIGEWREHPSVFVGIDKPVGRFLLFGGTVAEDFLGRCIDMAEYGLSGKPLPPANELGLPLRIVDRFAEWMESHGDATSLLTISTARHFARPQLLYDPWAGDALSIVLPSQALGVQAKSVRWTATAGPWSQSVEVTPPQRGLHAKTREAEIRLPEPFALIDIALEVDDARLRSWRYTGISKASPLLAFRPDTGFRIDGQRALRREPVWILAPRSATLSAVRDGVEIDPPVLEEFPFLSGSWAGYCGRHVDLTHADAIKLRLSESAALLELDTQGKAPDRAQLAGGNRPQLTELVSQREVFSGTPPSLMLPLPVRSNGPIPADRWQVHVRSLFGAWPRIDIRFSGAEPEVVASAHPDRLDIDLAHPRLLGSNPIGEFEVIARGPLGRDARFELLFLPALEVWGLDTLLVPRDDVVPPARLVVSTRPDLEVASDSAIATSVKLGAGAFRLDIDPAAIDVPIVIRGGGDPRDGIQAPITLRLHRVRWALTGLTGQTYTLTDQRLHLSRDELEQAPTPALVLDVPVGDQAASLSLEVVDSAGQPCFKSPYRPASTSRRFALRELLDTIRSKPDARLDLVVSIVPGELGHELRATAATITRELRVDDLRVEQELVKAVRHLTLRWRETLPVTNRIARFWPLWRPWEERPVELEIADTARGAWQTQIARALLPAGLYRIEMAVADPWTTSVPATLPAPSAANCTDVSIGDLAEVAEYLEELPTDHPLTILERFLATGKPEVLAWLPSTLDPHEVPAVVRAAMGVLTDFCPAGTQDDSLRAAVTVVRRTLFERAETLPALADLSGIDQMTDDRLRRLIVELGIMRAPFPDEFCTGLSPRQRRALWQLWTPLFFALELRQNGISNPDAQQAFANLVSATQRHEDDGLPSEGHVHLHRLLELLSYAFSGRELAFPGELLSIQRDQLRLLPSGPLDGDAWVLANFAWLIRLKTEPTRAAAATEWLTCAYHAAHEDLTALPTDWALVEGLRRRVPKVDHGPLSWLPFVVGVTALVERALAHQVISRSALMLEAERGCHSPREAFAAAPELYSRDLCLMDLYVARTVAG